MQTEIKKLMVGLSREILGPPSWLGRDEVFVSPKTMQNPRR